MALVVGTAAVVDASAGGPLGIAELSSSLSLVVYEESGSLKARTISIADPPTINAEVNIDLVTSRAVVVGLDATTAMVVYYDGTNAEARILSVSGTTITVESPTSLTHSSFTAPGIAKIDATNVLYTYSTVGSSKAVVLSVSGTTITENTIIEFEAATTQANNCAVYSSTKSINTWYDGSDSVGIIIDISGTTLTANTKKTIRTASMFTNDYSAFCVKASSTIAVWGGRQTAINGIILNVVQLSGSTFNVGANAQDFNGFGNDGVSAARMNDTRIVAMWVITGTAYEVATWDISGTSLTQSSDDAFNKAGGSIWNKCASVDGDTIIAHFESSSSVVLLTDAEGTHIWLSTDGAATFTNIGDSAWAGNIVGGVIVLPGTNDQIVFAAVGTNLYKTIDGGTNWSLETAIGYEVDFLGMEKDYDLVSPGVATIILAKRDASGVNRASLWDGTTLIHVNTAKSTTGGATSGGNIV